MKNVQAIKSKILLTCLILGYCQNVTAQDSTEKPEPAIRIHYYSVNNSVQYLISESVLMTGKKSAPWGNQRVEVYLDSVATENLLVSTVTDAKGKAQVIFPPAFKDKWNNRSMHSFIASVKGKADDPEVSATLDITKAKIRMDTSTSDGVHSINVQVMYMENGEWLPAKDVEMKVGIRRSGSILTAGEEETYTTDSSGSLSVEFKRDSLPGDSKGNIIIAAHVDENELYGNLVTEKTVPWGKATIAETGFFDQRTLWSTRFHTPPWLLFMAYSIITIVWGTLLYLAWQLYVIKKSGKSIA
jgi:hypothetical protein